MSLLISKKKQGDETAPYWEAVSDDVTLKCPNGHIGFLGGHRIKATGDVEPSVVCPRDECDFHDYIKLEGWNK